MNMKQEAPEKDACAGFGNSRNLARVDHPGKRQLLLLVLVAAFSLFAGPKLARGQARTLTEYEVKAGFLFNFLKFVEWPQETFAEPASPITIGIVGKDPYGSILDQVLQGKVVRGRPLLLKRFAGADDIRFCHVLLVGTSDSEEEALALRTIGRWHALTIGDTERFAQQGGIIGFRMEETVVRFDINVEAADRAGLRIDSRLLSLARLVKTNTGR